MKLNIIKLYEYSIYCIVFLYLGFINFYSDLNSISISIGVLISIFLFFIYLNQKDKKVKTVKYLYIFVISFIVMFMIQLVRLRSFSLSGYTLIDALIHDRYYAFVLLSFPLTEVLGSPRIGKRFLNNIYYLGIAILIFRFLAWILYNKMHFNATPGYFDVMGILWARNGVTRLPGTFLDNFVWVFALFRIADKRGKYNELYNILVLLLCFLYAYLVYDSRSQQIAYLSSLIIFFFIMAESIERKITYMVGLGIAALAILKTKYFTKLINTFSTTNVDYGSSTQIRMNTLNIYQSLWLEKGIWWGYGISNDGNYFSITDTTMINQSDLGILSMLFQYGIIGFMIIMSPFLMGVVVALRQIHCYANKFLFVFTMTTLLTSLMSQNMYDPFRFLIVPFLLSFISVISSNNKGENKD